MALRALMAKKKLDEKKKELDEIRNQKADFSLREAELEKAIEEATTDEEKQTVEEAINQFETDKAELDEKEKTLVGEVDTLEQELAEVEAEQDAPVATPVETPVEERKVNFNMNTRTLFDKMSVEQRNTIFEDEAMKNWLGEIRSAIKEKRAITNVGLTIPEVVLPLLRQNIMDDSKLLKHVTLRNVGGTARQTIMANYLEAIWVECCANLNELDLGFNDWSFDCYKIGAFYTLCKANVEDSDYDLAAEVITALGYGLALGVDKSIAYGRNSDTNMNMPQGILPSLEQTTKPSNYPTTARPWVDLHTTNIKALGTAEAPLTGIALFKEIVLAKNIIANKFARGPITWLMNESTYNTLVAESLSINASGAIVAGVNGTMPVLGGDVEVLDFIPNGVIIFGYFELYTLIERAGKEFASSEHYKFVQDQIVYKGTARYDGAPVIREAFGALGLNGAEVKSSDVVFPQDTANSI